MRAAWATGIVGLATALGVAACAHAGASAGADGYDDRADVESLRARLTSARASQGRGPAAPFMVAQVNLGYAKQWIADGIDPEIALQNAMEGSAGEGERTVRYWALGVDRLEDVRFPAVLMQPVQLNVAIAVFRRPQGTQPRYQVLLATPSLDEARFRLR